MQKSHLSEQTTGISLYANAKHKEDTDSAIVQLQFTVLLVVYRCICENYLL